MEKRLIVVGLTGGIASGKSTIAQFLREAAVPVIDADSVGHLVLEPNGEAYQPVIDAFGKGILDKDKRIDRTELGNQVFDNPEQRAKLEQITHPAIAKLAKKGIDMIAERGERLAIYEAALLVETGVYKGLDALVVTSCSVATQLGRLTQRDGLTKEAAAARIASQYPLEEKVSLADHVINTDCSLTATRQATLEVLTELRQRFELESDELNG